MENTKEPVKVLYFVDRMLRGGIQTFVLENWRHMDHTKVQIDFLLLDDGNTYELEDTLRGLDSRIYKLKGIWVKKPKDFVSYQRAVDAFFKVHHDYRVVHLHSSSKNYMVLKCAKKYGIPVRIAHSHNIGFQTTSKVQILIGNLFKPLLKYYATDYFACSEDAGRWLFGRKKITVIKNAVDIDKYRYEPIKADCMRKKLKLDGKKVVGHVGRFTHQKNHTFLIDVFKELVELDSDYRLLLIGEGALEEQTKAKAKTYGVENKIIFAGFKTNVEDYMQAMDLFVFPSEFEGLGLVLIEAQAAGLPCYASEKVVPQEAKVSDLLTYIPLEDGPKMWAEQIDKTWKKFKRETPEDAIAERGYSIVETAKQLERYYLEH
ncbi:MAG: glycosyltransferase family 1 protein [Faecalibacterium sp.]